MVSLQADVLLLWLASFSLNSPASTRPMPDHHKLLQTVVSQAQICFGYLSVGDHFHHPAASVLVEGTFLTFRTGNLLVTSLTAVGRDNAQAHILERLCVQS